MRGGEIHGVEPATAEALEHGARGEFESADDVLVEFFHERDGLRVAIHVAHFEKRDVPAGIQQRDVALRLVAEEFRAPDPRLARRGFCGPHEERWVASDGEV
ncbi:MAG: hypothetical protein NTV08_19790 [Verrucomicrobia bacterium]|nr:hypothetical protein [Verrucomicrobiota bacterium]